MMPMLRASLAHKGPIAVRAGLPAPPRRFVSLRRAAQGKVKTISWSVTCPAAGFSDPAAM